MDWLGITSQFLLIVPLSVAIIRWGKLEFAGKWIVCLLLVWLLAETVQYYLRIRNVNNWWVGFVFSPLQILFVGLFYVSLIGEKSKFIFWFCVAGGLLLMGEGLVRGFTEFSSVSLLYQCILFATLGLYVFYLIAKDRVEVKWAVVNAALMITLMGSAVYFGSFLKIDHPNLLYFLSDCHAVLLILSYSLLTFGIWKL